MGNVSGGNGGDAYDSVIATHYVRLLWFFPFVHVFYCPQRAPNRTSRFFYSLTFTASSPSPLPSATEASSTAAATVMMG